MALTCGQPGRPSISSTIEVEQNRLESGIVTLAAVGCCSIEQTGGTGPDRASEESPDSRDTAKRNHRDFFGMLKKGITEAEHRNRAPIRSFSYTT
jgi:hypothetical protein